MYLKIVVFILFSYLAVISLCSSRQKSQFLTVGLKRSPQEGHNFNRLRTKAAAIQNLMETCTNVTLTDFQDTYYYGSVELGSPSVSISVVFDTGSADLWVASKYLCVKYPSYCDHHVVYDHTASSSYLHIGTPFTINYQKGSVSGVVSQDNVNVGGLTIANQLFGEAETMDSDTATAQFAGVFGLAYPALAQIDGRTPIVNLFHQGLINQPVFAFSLNKKSQIDGELTLGGLDPSQYTGNITYTPVIEQAYWKILIQGISVGSQALVPSGAAIADSGTSLIVGPADYIDLINNAIGGQDYGAGINVVDCSKIRYLPNISVIIEGTPFVLRPSEYTLQVSDDKGNTVCVSGFMGAKNVNFFILGDVFMRQFYTVFDLGLNRVGFAPRREADPTRAPPIPSGGRKPLAVSYGVLLFTLFVLSLCIYTS